MFDAIVVGARCAGAPSAMLLARAGHRVLLLDKDPPGADMAHSTHYVQPVAVGKLRKWGLLEALEAVCPGFNVYSLDFGCAVVEGHAPAVDGDTRVFCPRRETLDPILVDGARAAGVEYRPDTKVTDVVVEEGRVRGVVVRHRDGERQEIPARVVIGADGPGSTIARAVGAPQYREVPAQQTTVWGYWTGCEAVDRLHLVLRPRRAVYASSTSGGAIMVGVNWVIDDYKALRRTVEASFHRVVSELAPDIAQQIERGHLVTPLRTGATRNFLRKPYGPGWVLVGDAGHKKDPCTAQGITDAFVDVDACMPILDAALRGGTDPDDDLASWHARRDARLVPLFDMTVDLAKFPAPSADEEALYRALASNPEATTQFLGLMSSSVSPAEFFRPENLEDILSKAH